MRQFIAVLFLCSLVYAQPDVHRRVKPPKSTILNGTSQYWSKTSPVGLDLSGSERITAYADRNFSSKDSLKWATGGTHSIDTSSTDKRTGTKSGKLVAVETLGADGLSGKTDFTSGDWISLDTSVHKTSANTFYTTVANRYIYRYNIFSSTGLAYKITIAGTYTGTGYLRVSNSGEEAVYINSLIGTFNTYAYVTVTNDKNILLRISGGTGTAVITTFKAELLAGQGDTTANHIKLAPANFTSLELGKKYCVELWARASKAGTNLTINIGQKSQTTSSISTVSGTFTKAVLNFQATATEIASNDSLRIYVNQADTVYIDDVSMTQKNDLLWGGAVKTSGTGVQTICNSSVTNSSRLKMFLNNNTPTVTITDGTTTVSAINSATVNNGLWHQMLATYSASGNLTLYVDNVAGTGVSAVTLGKITIDTLRIGRDNTGNYFSGRIAERQRIKFDALPADNGASIIYDAYQRFKMGLPYRNSYTGGTVVGWWDWQVGGRDKSGFGNHLTPTANPPIVGGR